MFALHTNTADLDQMPRPAASDLGLHCLPMPLLWVNHIQLEPFGVYKPNMTILQLHESPQGQQYAESLTGFLN